jgi:hypothetical protein
LLQPFFSAGFVLDGLAEPSFGDKAHLEKMFEMVFQEIPPAMVARIRLVGRAKDLPSDGSRDRLFVSSTP